MSCWEPTPDLRSFHPSYLHHTWDTSHPPLTHTVSLTWATSHKRIFHPPTYIPPEIHLIHLRHILYHSHEPHPTWYTFPPFIQISFTWATLLPYLILLPPISRTWRNWKSVRKSRVCSSSVLASTFVRFKISKTKQSLHGKKRFAVFPSPAGMSLSTLSLAGNILIFPGQGEFG